MQETLLDMKVASNKVICDVETCQFREDWTWVLREAMELPAVDADTGNLCVPESEYKVRQQRVRQIGRAHV